MDSEVLLWVMVSAQMFAWAYFSFKGGNIGPKQFYLFTMAMIVGQIATGIETYYTAAWRAFFIQVYFFLFTVFAGVQRYRKARRGTA